MSRVVPSNLAENLVAGSGSRAAKTGSSPPEVSAGSGTYHVEGGCRLRGEVRLHGAKNAVAKQIVASLLTDEPCTIGNVPRIGEIAAVLALLGEVGMRHRWLDDQTLCVHTPVLTGASLGGLHARSNRLSILALGCLVQRAGAAQVPPPGGCPIGVRPLDFHVQALTMLGADVRVGPQGYQASAKRLQGAAIDLPYPSVGGTESVLLAAVRAEGTTCLTNAAVEPEVLDTVEFLRKMGASIELRPPRTFVIQGVSHLRGATHRAIADRVEAASLAAAAAATDGAVRVLDARESDLEAFLRVFTQWGGGYSVDPDGITFYRHKSRAEGVDVETAPFPGFSTDWLPPTIVLLAQSDRPSSVHETVFENRLASVAGLRRMGAAMQLSSRCLGTEPCRFHDQGFLHSALIRPARLRGASLSIGDLRAGFAFVLAALTAEGASDISGTCHLERGCADLVGSLRRLGARITTL